MIANMNKQGQTKLLAAIAVLAMVVCAFAVVLPSENVDAATDTESDVNLWDTSITTLTADESYYISADKATTENPAKITMPSGSGTAYVYADPKAVIQVTPADGSSIIMHIAGAGTWNETTPAVTQPATPAKGDIDYLVGGNVQFTGGTVNTAFNVTVEDNGFTAPNASGSNYSVTGAITLAGASNTIYYNPLQIQTNYNVAEGQTLTIPTGTKFPQSMTVNGAVYANNEWGNPVTTVTVTDDQTTENRSTNLTFTGGAAGALTVGGSADAHTTVAVTLGSVTASSLTFTSTDSVKAITLSQEIEDNTAFSGTLYSTITETTSSVVRIYNMNVTNDITLNKDGTDTNVGSQWFYVIGNGSYTGTITKTAGIGADGQPVAIGNITVAMTGGSSLTIVESTDKTYAMTMSGSTTTIGTENALASSNFVLNGIESEVGEGYTLTFEGSGIAFGNVTLTETVKLTSDAVIPMGMNTVFDQGGVIDLNGNNLYILGSVSSRISTPNVQIINSAGSDSPSVVYTTSETTLNNYIGKDVSTDSISTTINVTDANKAEIAEQLMELPSGTVVELNNSTGSTIEIPINGSIQWDGITVKLTGANSIVFSVKDAASFELNDVTIDDQNTSGTDSRINALEGSAVTFNGISRLYLVVDIAQGASENINIAGVEYTNTTSDVKVGYGTTLDLKDSQAVNTIDIYGNLVISGSVTIPANQNMEVHENASVTVAGTLTIRGTASFDADSETVIDGTMNVGESNNGGTIVNVYGDMTVSETGTLNVQPGKNGDALSFNRLNAPAAGSEYSLDVYGTFSMRGQMSGVVQDMGDVQFNGAVYQSAEIVVYDGVTLNVDSVSGSLKVTDTGICAEQIKNGNGKVDASTGNQITLKNVSNVVVSVSLDTYNYTVDNQNCRDYRSIMSVYGTVGAVGKDGSSLSIDPVTVKSVGPADQYQAYIVVPEGQTLTYSANVNMEVKDGLLVNGNVNFIVGSDNDVRDITGDGEITVNGTMRVANATQPETIMTVNAMKYSERNESTGVVTYVYTNFTNALAAGPTAEQNTINVLGKVTVSESADIGADVDVVFIDDAELTVDSGVTLTLKDGSYMTGGTSASIVVDGTFTAEDYANDLFVSDISADVVRTEGTSRTWTSLASAIENGWTQIDLCRPVIIDEDLTIPAGTTVTTNIAPGTYTVEGSEYRFSILVIGATLTVEGTLDMQSTAQGALVIADDSEKNEGEMIVTGTVTREVLTSVTRFDNLADDVAGVFFTLQDGAFYTYYITNMANAGEIVSATNQLASNVDVHGNVVADSASFAVSETGTNYSINVANGANLSMNDLTIGAGVSLVIGQKASETDSTMFTGTVTASVGDGSTNTAVSLSRTSGITFQAYSVMGVTTTYGLSAYTGADGYDGTVTVDEGTLGIGYDSYTGMTVVDKSTLTVASGATLNIPAGMALTISNEDGVEISGTITVSNVNGIVGGPLLVSGTMNTDVSFDMGGTIIVTGSLNVAEGNTMIVDEHLIIGTGATSLGVGGSISGDYRIANPGYILAYAGADMSQATVNWNTALNQTNAQATTYYVNNTEYATVYANGGVAITDIFGVNREGTNDYIEIEIVGYDTGIYDPNASGVLEPAYRAYDWYDINGTKISSTASIGSTDAVYIEFDLAQVKGTVSKDAGIILTIDNLIVGEYNGDVSQLIRNYGLSVGTHTISWSERTGYNIENVTVTFNGQAVENGGTIEITPDMTTFTIIAEGAIPGAAPGGSTGSSSDDGMGLTDYLLIILVILIVVMAIMVALRLMRS